MKIAQIIPSYSNATGGLFVSISNIVRSSIDEGEEVYVLGPAGTESDEEVAAWHPANVERLRRVGPTKFGFSPHLVRRLCELSPDVVHAHGLWTFTTLAAARWSRRSGRPYIISIHGMLEPWALQQSRWKKGIARNLYQDRTVCRAACLRATSRMEIESIRAAGYSTAVALIPNGVALPERPDYQSRAPERPTRQALFLSRIHPKKGLLNLVEAWRRVRPGGWELLIVGPDEGGHAREVQRAIDAADLSACVRIAGPRWGADRFRLYWDSDLFVLPSFSENFALVVAEALACEVPVITTRGLPWEELETHDCGWWTEIGVEPLAAALREATAASDSDRIAMGRRGRALVQRNYTWAAAGRQLSETYRWMVGECAKPTFVDVGGASDSAGNPGLAISSGEE